MLARADMDALLETRRPRLVLVLFCLLAWLPGFFTLPPGDRDESRFAQATKQMLETGDFVRIANGVEARNRKPIGIHWLQAPFVAVASAAGLASPATIWPYRVPSLLGGLLAVLATHAAGLLLFERRAALLGALFLGGSVILTVEVHNATTDAALLGSVVVAQVVLAYAHRLAGQIPARAAAVFWLALAVGVLLKGPIGPMVTGLTALTLALVERRGRWLLGLRPGWGVPLLLACVLPWFVAIGIATGGRFFSDAVGGDLGRKLVSGDDAHWGPPGLHLLMLPLLILPATAALGGGLREAWRERGTQAVRFLLCWVVPAWLVFEAAPTKLPHYTMPLYPAVCLLLAAWVLRRERGPAGRWFAGLGALLCVALGVALAVVPALLHVAVWLGLPAAAAGLWIARVQLRLVGRHSLEEERRAVVATALAMPLLYWTALGFELPALRPVWIAPRVVADEPPRPLGAVGFAEPSLMFLAGTDTRWLLAEEAAQALASGEVRSLLVGERDLAAVTAGLERAGVRTQIAGTVSGYNYSRGRFTVLTLLVGRPP